MKIDSKCANITILKRKDVQEEHQKLRSIIYNTAFLMNTGHRQSHAKSGHPNQNRLSMPTNFSPLKRLSFQPQQPQSALYRVSDLSYIPTLAPHFVQPSLFSSQQIYMQPSPKLLQSCQSLHDKILSAKKQLTIFKKPTHNKESSFELKSWKQDGSLSISQEFGLGKIEESTINMQSQKKLSMLKSKQKLPWINKIKTYYVAEVTKGIIGLHQQALQHIKLSHQILKASKKINLPDESIIPRTKVMLDRAVQNIKKKVLILDLDETLFHSSQQRISEDDFEVEIPCGDIIEIAYITLRPFALSFLKKVNHQFEVIAFTASQKAYADAILDELDPQKQLIQHRLYREHCVKLNDKIYAKDLTILNRDLSQMVLVDNSPLSYLYQIENGIPVLPYYGGQDSQLLRLEKYLQVVSREEDVREINRRTFKLENYWCFTDLVEMVQELYCAQS